MTETTDILSKKNGTGETADQKKLLQKSVENQQEAPLETSGKFREASYVVLFIAAVFVVNAMETGSYRTPWPVAIVTTLAGLGLFGYSWYLRSQANAK
jgi:hypothetical protein